MGVITFSISLTAILGAIQALIAFWIKTRLEQSIRHEYDQKLAEYSFGITQRTQATRIAELFAKWLKYNDAELAGLPDEVQRTHREDLNKLTWELAIWIPEETLVNEIMKSLSKGTGAMDVKEIILHMRELVLKKSSGALKWKDLVHFH